MRTQPNPGSCRIPAVVLIMCGTCFISLHGKNTKLHVRAAAQAAATAAGECGEGGRHSAREINFLGPLKSNDNVYNSISLLPSVGVGVGNPLLSMR